MLLSVSKKQKEKIDTTHYETAVKYLKGWLGQHCKLRHINEKFLEKFKDHLLTTTSLKSKHAKLNQNSAASYYDKFANIVQQAFLDGLLAEDYTVKTSRITNVGTSRQIINDGELKLLLDNPIDDELVFKSSIFALLTGCRFSALKILQWNHFHYSPTLQSWYIYFSDPKPDRAFKHFINQQAVDLLGGIQQGESFVFPGLNYSRTRVKLQQWFINNGLKDKAKFHNWRHKYATDLIEKGEDLYIVSKMLNHKHIKTTQIYAQVPDTNRARAAAKASINLK